MAEISNPIARLFFNCYRKLRLRFSKVYGVGSDASGKAPPGTKEYFKIFGSPDADVGAERAQEGFRGASREGRGQDAAKKAYYQAQDDAIHAIVPKARQVRPAGVSYFLPARDGKSVTMPQAVGNAAAMAVERSEKIFTQVPLALPLPCTTSLDVLVVVSELANGHALRG